MGEVVQRPRQFGQEGGRVGLGLPPVVICKLADESEDEIREQEVGLGKTLEHRPKWLGVRWGIGNECLQSAGYGCAGKEEASCLSARRLLNRQLTKPRQTGGENST